MPNYSVKTSTRNVKCAVREQTKQPPGLLGKSRLCYLIHIDDWITSSRAKHVDILWYTINIVMLLLGVGMGV